MTTKPCLFCNTECQTKGDPTDPHATIYFCTNNNCNTGPYSFQDGALDFFAQNSKSENESLAEIIRTRRAKVIIRISEGHVDPRLPNNVDFRVDTKFAKEPGALTWIKAQVAKQRNGNQ